MLSTLKAVFYSYKTFGFKWTLHLIITGIRRIIKTFQSPNKRRRILSKIFDDKFMSVVKYGPFKGLVLSKNLHWGELDRASMLFGLYEKEIIDYIAAVATSKKFDCFIDIGASNGYYAIGVLVANFFPETICFELSSEGRKIIKKNAAVNGVTNRLKIYGAADANFLDTIQSNLKNKNLILCDIEGFEFDLFSFINLEALQRNYIIIEIHNWIKNGEKKFVELQKNASVFFNIRILTTGSRDLSKFTELECFTDDDRWSLCSEGRPFAMKWLVLEPKSID